MLQIPEKLLPLLKEINNYRYFLVDGGRGGGKSQAIARIICYIANKLKLRVVCGREIQNTIDESVYTIFKDLIIENNLAFDVQSQKIINKLTGTPITFKGFREQGSVNIKGLEGVDVLWIDEAQSIKKHTLDIIIPTIRKEKAKVFFTMNRYLKNDPVYKEFHDRPDCLHIHINYDENKYCSEALKREAAICKEKNPDDYGHIWQGHPLEEADNFLFSEQKLDLCKAVDFMGCGYHETFLGVDIARYGGDHSVAAVIQRRGPLKFHVKHLERWSKKDLMDTTGRVIDLQSRFKPSATAIDADGMGAGVVDRLSEQHHNVNEFHGGPQKDSNPLYGNCRTEWFMALAELVSAERIEITQQILIDSLLTLMFTHKSNGQKILLSKEQMRTKGFKSPDPADALMMALFATSFKNIKIEEEESFKTPFVQQQQNNLFKIAGYK